MAPESRQLLSNTQAIDGYSESSIEVPQWGEYSVVELPGCLPNVISFSTSRKLII